MTDVERSVGFYHHLGFAAESVFKYRDRMSLAALECDGAEVMFEAQPTRSITTAKASCSTFIRATSRCLRNQLLAAGIEAGEIEDGSSGPRHEMRVTDPDG